MSERLTRKQFLGRTAAGGALLTFPGVVSACGTSVNNASKSSSSQPVQKKLAKTLNFDNWPLYIDVGKSHNHPSLQEFAKQTGVKVNYVENINDNQSFFGKIQGPLSRGEGIGARPGRGHVRGQPFAQRDRGARSVPARSGGRCGQPRNRRALWDRRGRRQDAGSHLDGITGIGGTR